MSELFDPQQTETFRDAVTGGPQQFTSGVSLRHLCRDLFPGRVDLIGAVTASDELGLPPLIADASASQLQLLRQRWVEDLELRGGIRRPLAIAVIDLWIEVVRPAGPEPAARADTRGGLRIRSRFAVESHRGPIVGLAYDAAHSLLATAGFDREAHIHDADTGELRLVLKGHAGPLSAVRFDPIGRFVLTTSNDRTACIWSAETGDTVHVLRGHEASVWSGAFSPDGTIVATGGSDSTIRLWDLSTGRSTGLVPAGGIVDIVAFDASSRFIAAGTSGGRVEVWDTSTTRRVVDFSTGGTIHALSFHPSSSSIVAAGEGGAVGAALPGGTLTRLTMAPAPTVWSVTFSEAARNLSLACDDGTCRVIECSTNTEAFRVAPGHGEPFVAAAALPGFDGVLTVTRSGALEAWDLRSGERLGRADQGGVVESALLASPPGVAFVGTDRGVIARWELGTEPRSF